VTEQVRDVLPYLLISAVMGIAVNFLSLLNLHPGTLLSLQIILGVMVYVTLNAVFNTWSYCYTKAFIKEKITKKE
jgi:hypothetical protein